MQQPYVLPPCPACGAPREAPDTRYCVHCGTPLPPVQVVPAAAPIYPSSYPPLVPAAPPRKKRTGLWIALGIFALLLICMAIVIVTNGLAILERGGMLF